MSACPECNGAGWVPDGMEYGGLNNCPRGCKPWGGTGVIQAPDATLKAEPAWDDKPLPEDDAIRAAHPARTDRHDLYAEATRLVGAKRSKYALVDLVNWLLSRAKSVECPSCEEGPPKDGQDLFTRLHGLVDGFPLEPSPVRSVVRSVLGFGHFERDPEPALMLGGQVASSWKPLKEILELEQKCVGLADLACEEKARADKAEQELEARLWAERR